MNQLLTDLGRHAPAGSSRVRAQTLHMRAEHSHCLCPCPQLAGAATFLASGMLLLAAAVTAAAGVVWDKLAPNKGKVLKYAGGSSSSSSSTATAAADSSRPGIPDTAPGSSSSSRKQAGGSSEPPSSSSGGSTTPAALQSRQHSRASLSWGQHSHCRVLRPSPGVQHPSGRSCSSSSSRLSRSRVAVLACSCAGTSAAAVGLQHHVAAALFRGTTLHSSSSSERQLQPQRRPRVVAQRAQGVQQLTSGRRLPLAHRLRVL